MRDVLLRKLYSFVVGYAPHMLAILPDKMFLKAVFRLYKGQKLDLNNPITMDEKLQWLKLYNRNPSYQKMVDKFESKKYISKLIGDKYIIPTLGVWDTFDSINFDELPEQFVLKCTHDSGSIAICKDKSTFDYEEAKRKLEKGLKRNIFWHTREWPYKNLPPRIIAEKYMTDKSGGLVDYKFYCFDGYVDCVLVCIDRHLKDTKFYFFDKDWNLKRLNVRGKNAPEDFTLPKPECIDEMFEIASKLSKGMPFIRVDLYENNGKIFFGELTFFPDSGFDPNRLPESDLYFGNLIDLELVK